MCKSGTTNLFLLTGILVALLTAGCGSDDENGGAEACSIRITEPEAGDVYTAPEQQELSEENKVAILWNAAGGGDVNIELLKGGELRGEIASGTSNDGSYFWTIEDPEDFELLEGTGSDYAVRITSTSEAGCTNTSPRFTINDYLDCAIDVVIDYPGMAGGMEADAGDLMTIDWTAAASSGTYDLELWWNAPAGDDEHIAYLSDPVAGNSLVGGWIMDSFHYREGVGYYEIRVQDRAVLDCMGRSSVFLMYDDEICSIFCATPDGDRLSEGVQFDIQWTAANTKGQVMIELYYGMTIRVGQIVSAVDAGRGIYRWAVTDFDYEGQTNSRYRIRIEDADDPYCYTFSESFTIIP